VYFLVIAQPSSEIPEGLMNYPVFIAFQMWSCLNVTFMCTLPVFFK
jgi:hypothetical protein